MITGHFTEVKEEQPQMAGMQATIRWLIAAKDGATNFAMRRMFSSIMSRSITSAGVSISLIGAPT